MREQKPEFERRIDLAFEKGTLKKSGKDEGDITVAHDEWCCHPITPCDCNPEILVIPTSGAAFRIGAQGEKIILYTLH